MYRAKYRATKMYHPIYYQDQKASISYRMKYEYLIQSELKCPNIVFIFNECPHVPKLAKFKPPRCPIGVYWNTLCLMRDVWTIKTYMI